MLVHICVKTHHFCDNVFLNDFFILVLLVMEFIIIHILIDIIYYFYK